MDLRNKSLFFGDNLNVLNERIPDNFFDLIYLDPPFNSNRDYNVLFKEGKIDSSAQIHAFEDTWKWTPDTVKLFDELKSNKNPKIAILINNLAEFIGHNEMMAYLVNMTARLIPLHRVLKKTGSLFLHCDPTASHYLKVVLDVIFDKKNFVNEIIWAYEDIGGKSPNYYKKKHDVILFYQKSEERKMFNVQYKKLSESTIKRFLPYFDTTGKLSYRKLKETNPGVFKKLKGIPENLDSPWLDMNKGQPLSDWWTDISPIKRGFREAIGYPTQKPEALLERIINGSSNEGDWILDPFCGCGTTVAVAEKLHRKWIGIDISMLAINAIKNRMLAHYSDIKINVDGIPYDYEAAKSLAQKDKFSFQDWAISLVKAHPPSGESKRGADQGIDGLILFHERQDLNNPKLRKIIVQVKGGVIHREDVATLKGDIEREESPMGILIALNEPTLAMEKEVSLAGQYKYSENTSFPKIQILSIKDYFDGRMVKLPSDIINPFKRAEAKADQKSLF